MDPANISSNYTSTFAQQISIEGILEAEVIAVNKNGAGDITSIDLGPIASVLASIYTADNAFADFVDTSDNATTAAAKFSNFGSTPAITYGLDGGDDFYKLFVDADPLSATFGKIVEFELAMSVISNNSFIGTTSGLLSDGTVADLYGQGEIQYSLVGDPTTTGDADQFVVGDGKFAIIVPEPASLMLLGLGGLALIRRK